MERVFNSTQYDYNIIAYILITKNRGLCLKKGCIQERVITSKITDLKLQHA